MPRRWKEQCHLVHELKHLPVEKRNFDLSCGLQWRKKKRFSDDGFFIHSINQHYLLCCRFVIWLCFISTFSCSFILFSFVFFLSFDEYAIEHPHIQLQTLRPITFSVVIRHIIYDRPLISTDLCSLIRCVRNTESTITVSKRVSERESERERKTVQLPLASQTLQIKEDGRSSMNRLFTFTR